MWAFGCAKVLNWRFQETHSLSFVLPRTFSVCHSCQLYSLLPVILWWWWRSYLVHSLAGIGWSLYSCKPHFVYFSWWSFNTFLCRRFHGLLSFIKIVQVLLLLNTSPCIAYIFDLLLFASVFTSALAIFLIWSYQKEMWSPEFLLDNLLKLGV